MKVDRDDCIWSVLSGLGFRPWELTPRLYNEILSLSNASQSAQTRCYEDKWCVRLLLLLKTWRRATICITLPFTLHQIRRWKVSARQSPRVSLSADIRRVKKIKESPKYEHGCSVNTKPQTIKWTLHYYTHLTRKFNYFARQLVMLNSINKIFVIEYTPLVYIKKVWFARQQQIVICLTVPYNSKKSYSPRRCII